MPSPVYGLRTPGPSDAPDGPGGFLDLASDIEPYLVGQFANAIARDAAWPAGQRRVGMLAAIGSGAAMQVTVWDGTGWRQIWPDDTGWTTESITASGYTGTVRYRRIGAVIHVTYSVGPTTGTIAAGAAVTNFSTLPEGYRPVTNAIISSLVSGLYPASAEVGTDGKISCRNNHSAAVTSIRGAGSYASS